MLLLSLIMILIVLIITIRRRLVANILKLPPPPSKHVYCKVYMCATTCTYVHATFWKCSLLSVVCVYRCICMSKHQKNKSVIISTGKYSIVRMYGKYSTVGGMQNILITKSSQNNAIQHCYTLPHSVLVSSPCPHAIFHSQRCFKSIIALWAETLFNKMYAFVTSIKAHKYNYCE